MLNLQFKIAFYHYTSPGRIPSSPASQASQDKLTPFSSAWHQRPQAESNGHFQLRRLVLCPFELWGQVRCQITRQSDNQISVYLTSAYLPI